MSKSDFFASFIIIITLTIKSHGIDSDYFDIDGQEENRKEVTHPISQEQVLNYGQHYSVESENQTQIFTNDYYEDPDDYEIVINKSEDDNLQNVSHLRRQNDNETRSEITKQTEQDKDYYNNTTTENYKKPMTKQTFINPLYDEYEDSYTSTLKLFRHQSHTSIRRVNNFQETSEQQPNLLNKFYDVKPKTIRPSKKRLNYENKQNSEGLRKVWYILEEHSCELDSPLIYGSVPAQDGNNIFKIHNEGIVNISISAETPQRSRKPAVSLYPVNRWCNMPPCYADHTLCQYNDNKYSSLCEPKYYVHVLSPHERGMMVNMMNSMRNRVASGLVKKYKHLPTAANMNQLLYDIDLENMALSWLFQCKPGPAPCVAMDGPVSQLECTKRVQNCCYGRNRLFKTKDKSEIW